MTQPTLFKQSLLLQLLGVTFMFLPNIHVLIIILFFLVKAESAGCISRKDITLHVEMIKFSLQLLFAL